MGIKVKILLAFTSMKVVVSGEVGRLSEDVKSWKHMQLRNSLHFLTRLAIHTQTKIFFFLTDISPAVWCLQLARKTSCTQNFNTLEISLNFSFTQSTPTC